MGALQEQKPNTTVSYNPNEAHIVYASDDGFAEILGVSMVSLYENSKDMEFIAVYVLDSGMGSVSASFLLMFFANIVGSSTASAKALTYLGRHTLFLMSFDYFSDFISVRVLQIFRVHNWLFSFCGKVLVLVIGLQLLQLAIKVIPNESAKKFLSKY